ncbi:Anosmin-1 [Mizuhopecten yessoensis]|uniref:Anosmin-1 n=2 Tax=Mizuhopecten yessoensis TaxID=6573 RepID=A0A210QFF2_MIZYE|nr:Anosmin-1 [Mizuhopecten yessoensis]
MRGTVLPLTLGILILGTIPGVTSDSHGGTHVVEPMKEMPDPFDALEEIIGARKAAEKGCNIMKAKHCFLEMAGATVKILGGGMSREEQKMTCWQVHEYRDCVEDSMSGCPMSDGNWRGMQALEPYVPLLSSVANTVCMEDGERKEMDDCPMETAGHCLMGFFYVAAEAYSPATCWQSLHSSGCLESVLKECKNPYVQRMKSIITNQIRLTSSLTCVMSGCHPDAAFECLMSAKYAAESPLATMYRSPILCGRLTNAITCIINNTIGCPADQYNELAMGILHLDKASKVVCPADSFSAVPENVITQNLAAFMAISETPFTTPETVCPYFKYAEDSLMKVSLEDFSLDNVMKTKMVTNNIVGDYCKMDKEMDDCEMWQTAKPMCDVAQAEMCTNMAELPFLLAEVEILGKETVCQEVRKLAKCVNSKISGCRMDQLPGVNFAFWYILGEVADYCPIQELLSSSSCKQEKCQTMEAFYKCFPMVTQDDFSSGRSCMMMKETLECVKMYTSGCVMSLGMVPIAYTVRHYLSQFTPYCMVPHFDDMHDSVTDPRHIEGGMMMLQALQYALTNGSDIVRDMCHVLYTAGETKEEIKPHPMIAFAIKKMMGYGTELFEYLCTRYPEDSLKTMSTENMTAAQTANQPGCEAEKAAYCFAMHTTSMMVYQFMSLDDRHTLCRDGYNMVMECIKNHTSGCSAERKAVFESSKEITGILQVSYCPSDKMSEYSKLKMDGCAPETAQYCLDWYLEELPTKSAFHIEDSCEKAGKAVQCMWYHTVNCTSSTDLTSVMAAAKSIVSMVGHKCFPMASPDLCESLTYLSDHLVAEQSSCAYEEAMDCVNLFTAAKPALEKVPEMVCHAGHKAVVCAMVKGSGCTEAQKDALNTSIQTVAATVMPLCANMSMETRNPCNVTYAENQLVCNTNYLTCFAGFTEPASMCTNAPAIKACISLHLRGCDVNLVYENQLSVMVTKQMLEDATGLSCDIVPTLPPGVASPTYTRNATCMGGMDIMTQYLYNPNATEMHLCKAWHAVHDCVLESVDQMPIMLKSYMTELARSISEQMRLRCFVEDNFELIYGKEENVEDWDAFLNVSGCNLTEASVCLGSYFETALYSGLTALQDKEFFCGSFLTDQLQCIHNHTDSCPAPAKARFMRVIDWSSSISTNLGICSIESPRQCDPREAVKCIIDLSSALLAYGEGDETNALCAALIPTEMCVTYQTSGCSDEARLSVEYTYASIAAMIMKKCEEPKLYMEMANSCDAKEECNFERSKHCLMEVAEKAWSVVEGYGDRMSVCREVVGLGECAQKNMMGCKDMQKDILSFYGEMMKTLVSNICDAGSKDMVPERTDSPKMCVTLAGHCMKDFMTVTLGGTLTGSCGQAPGTITCLMTAIKSDCHPPQREMIKMAMEQISMLSERVCSYGSCNLELAKMCVMEADSLIKKAADRFMESSIMCGALEMSMSCAHKHFMSCDRTTNPFMAIHLKELNSVKMKLCDEHKKEYDIQSLRIPDTAGLMALAAIVTNPLATKEQICPQALAIEQGIAQLAFELSASEYDEVAKAFYLPSKIIGDMCYREEDKQDTGVGMQCDELAAVSCLAEANLVTHIKEAVFYGWQGACMSVQQLMCCVTQKTSNCPSVKLAHQIIMDGVNLVSDHCPVEEIYKHFLAECKMPTVQPCKVADAFTACFPPMEDANRANVCSNLSMIAACVHKHAAGCSIIQTSALQFYVEQFSLWVQPCTYLVGLDWGIYSKGDEYGRLVACNSVYMSDLQHTLNSTQDLKESFCRISQKASTCYLLNQHHIPAYLGYVLESKQRSYGKLEEYCDMGKAEKDGECPKSGDAGICVMNCSSDFECEGQKKCCFNNCGYTCVMPTGVTTTTAVAPVAELAGCQVGKAATCATAYIMGLDNLNLLPLDQRGSVCRQYWNMKHCVMTNLENCSEKRKAIFMEVDELVKHMYDVSCEESMQTTLLRVDGLCVPDVAEYCINALGEMIYYAPTGSEKQVCRTSYHIMQCVQRSLESCPENVTMNVINSMEPVITMLGDSCPLASAIKCNTTAWRDTVTHAACNEDAVWGAFQYFQQIATAEAKNSTAVCKAFEDISIYATRQTLLCDHSSLTMINQTWWLIMSTYGKYCKANGHMSPAFMGAMESEQMCMHQPTCSNDWSVCFPDMMEARSDDICMNKEKILMCMDKVLAGCDTSYRENSFHGLLIVIGNMNLSCNLLDAINSNMTSLAGLKDTTVDPCLLNLMTGGGKWLHSHLNFDSRGICELFENFTECSSNYLQYPMPPVYKGMFKQFVQQIKTYTKLRCEINEAHREVWWDEVKHMPGVDYLIDQIEQGMKKSNDTVYDSMNVMEHLFQMFMSLFKDMPHNAQEPESCELNMADNCMADTVLGALYIGYNPLGSREAACKSTHASYECVLEATKSCNSMTRVRYFRMLEWIARLGLSSGVCPMEEGEQSKVPECDYDGAMDCVGELSKTIVYLQAGDSKAALISPLGPTEMCIAEKTWMCEPRYRKMVESTYNDLKTIAISVSMPAPRAESMRNERMKALDMAADMCPDDDDMDDEDRKSPCDVSSAMLCISYLQKKLPEMGSNNEEACQAMVTMQMCVKRNMMGCMSSETSGVRAMMKEISEKVHCPALQCDMCSARTCVRQLHRAVMHRKASCIDVWKTKACVREHMSHCSGEMMSNVSMEMERVMRDVSSAVCEHPTVNPTDCTMGLAKVAHKILGLGVDLEDLMMMGMDDDKIDEDEDKDSDDKDDKDDMDDKDDVRTTATPKTTATKNSTVTNKNATMPDMANKSSMLTGKQIMFLERLFSLVAGSKSGEDCEKNDMHDDDSMESMCQSASMAWHCVESHLDMVPEGMRSVARASLNLIGEAITAKCIEETQKEPLMCFSCKNAHSNEECNAQQPQTCHGDRQSCYTIVDNGRITKGCAYRVPLRKTSECVNYGKKCAYFCDKSQCNWQQHRGVIDPPTCDRRAATLCGMTLVSNMLHSEHLNCGVAMKALGCVQHFTKDCMSHKEAMMSKHAEAALHSPAMMQCYAKDIPCTCGYCSVLSLARVQHNTYLTRVEKCM